jgi:hypothetical protein
MNAQVDKAMVREFLEIISAHARQVINGTGSKGVLQLCRINPANDSVVPSRFTLDDVEAMVRTAIDDAAAGHNAYIEARTVRDDLRGNKRGALEDTAWVFGVVADCDADKGKGGNITVRPSLVIETSPGNFHFWYLFTHAIPAEQAKLIGDAVRASSGTDQDTGVITQCYRVAGTPNFPSPAKQARGRLAIEATRIVEQTGRLFDPDELLRAFAAAPSAAEAASTTSAAPAGGAPIDDEATLPEELLKDIREGGVGRTNDASRSALFQSVVDRLKRRRWSVDSIVALLEKYPNGVGAKYAKRLRKEVERSYTKAVGGALAGPSAAGAGSPGSAPGPAPAASPAAAPHVLPTIRLVDGQLPRAVEETERAMVSAGLEIYSRADELVFPLIRESRPASNGRKTVTARLRAFSVDAFIEPVAEAAIFQRWSVRQKTWIDIDPPQQLVRMVLSRERRRAFLPVNGIITTPTLRPDGSLLAAPGYDPYLELYLHPTVQLPPIPARPTWQDAQAALAKLKHLLREFSFRDRQGDGLEKRLNCSVALSALLTVLLRGSMPTSPIYLMRADTPGTGKSYLVDVIAMIATGQLCPVIAISGNKEEVDKCLGSVLLDGIPVVSLDNCIHDLSGVLLNQFTERPVVKIRILGRSEMPPCESHTAVFATGNNVGFKADMVRRGLICNLEALEERPELREFECDTLEIAAADRGVYVAAGLTIVRAYLAAGAPRVCGPLASYAVWTRLARSPLIWLGEPDPVTCMDASRDEDEELSDIREFFALWLDHGLGLDTPYLTATIIEEACVAPPPNYYGPQPFKQFLLRVAAVGGSPNAVSPERLGRWLRSISGRIVSLVDAQGTPRRYRLTSKRQAKAARAHFSLEEV